MNGSVRKPTSCSAVMGSSPFGYAHCTTLLPFPFSFPSLPFPFSFLLAFVFFPLIMVSSPPSPRTPSLSLFLFLFLLSSLSLLPFFFSFFLFHPPNILSHSNWCGIKWCLHMLSCVHPTLFPPCMRPCGCTHDPHAMVPCGIMPHVTMSFVLSP